MIRDSEMQVYINELETNGFCIIKGIVTEDFATNLRAALLRALEQDADQYGHRPGKFPDLVDNLVPYGGPFFDLLAQPMVQDIFHGLLDPNCILYNYGSSVLRPSSTPPASDIHVDSPRVIPNYTSGLLMTLALDDFTEENGATLYMPGSHTSLAKPDEQVFMQKSVSVARPRGAAVVFNPRVWHRAGANKTGVVRCGVTLYAVRPFMKQRFDFPRMISQEMLPILDSRIKQFLGFDARVPSSMCEYYVPASERLYKGGQG